MGVQILERLSPFFGGLKTLCFLIPISMNFIASSEVVAQEQSDKFSGTFQFIEGEVRHKRGKKSVDAEFKDLILVDDEVLTSRQSIAKIISRSRCKIVLYSSTRVKADRTKSKLYYWRLAKGPLRVICKENRIPEIVRRGKETFEIQRGEFVLDDKRLVVVNGLLKASGQELKSGEVYVQKKRKWVLEKPKKNDKNPAFAKQVNFFELNSVYPAPKDSYPVIDPRVAQREKELELLTAQKAKEEAEKEKKAKENRVQTRFTAAYGFGNGNFKYTEGANSADLDVESIRLSANFPGGEYSFIAYVETLDIDRSENGEGGNGSVFIDENNKTRSLGLGFRYHHQKWWSTYFNFGVGSHNMTIEADDGVTRLKTSAAQNSLNIHIGVEAHLTAPSKDFSWTGLYLGAEIFHYQSIGLTQEFEDFPNPPNELIDRDGSWNNTGIRLFIGTYLQFFEE